MADFEDGGDANEKLQHEEVDVSQLKLPEFKGFGAQEVRSGEEDEDVIYNERARVYVRSGGEWRERGNGEVKLLKHKTTGYVRIILRQDKTLKLRMNHKVAVTAPAKLTANAGNDKSWVWTAEDFADEKVETMTFAIRFKDVEMSKAFAAAYEGARAANAKLIESGVKGAHAPSPAKAPAPAAGGAGAPGGSFAAFAAAFSAAATGGASSAAPAVAPAAAPAAASSAHAIEGSKPVPVTEQLSEIYGAAGETAAIIRYGAVSEAFRAAFGVEPSFFVRAPGRVNLIGEHVDYHSYGVLPMALAAQDVVIAVSVGAPGGPVKVANRNAAKYPAAELPSNPAAPVEAPAADGSRWASYVHCGYKGAFAWARESGAAPEPLGLNLLVDGAVPAGAGVSSSSALVVASLLATARALGAPAALPRAGAAEAARVAEHAIGTMSGGMDQAIACLAAAGAAARIEFAPALRAEVVPLPAGAAFVVAHCGESSAKGVDPHRGYNLRVVEGALAAKLLAKRLALPAWAAVSTLHDVQAAAGMAGPGALVAPIASHLKDGASVAELEAAFGQSLASLFEGEKSPAKKAAALAVLASLPADGPALHLAKRARHVATEAERVGAFAAACRGVEGGAGAQLARLGELMNESHASCRDDYDCSSPGLDELTEAARAAGALGSRLTGAGWGGCTVSLVEAGKVDAFLAALAAGFYAKRGLGGDKEALAAMLFASVPGSGAAIYTPPASVEV